MTAPSNAATPSALAALRFLVLFNLLITGLLRVGAAQDKQSIYPPMPPGDPPSAVVKDADAKTAADMKRYAEAIPGSEITFDMLPIPGGRFVMGSPDSEPARKSDEGPQHEVELAPFWMEKFEATWDEYHVFMSKLDLSAREQGNAKALPQDKWADAVSRPTPPYVPMDFGMGIHGFPAICMTQLAARQYTKWLSMKTGRFYRLPTEAEWEYACRAGTKTAYSFGDDAKALGEYAWSYDNSDAHYHPVGQKKPNPWGLHDMHGNVAEWCLDQLDAGFYASSAGTSGTSTSAVGVARNPVRWPTDAYPHVVRGGSWDDDADRLRSAARRGSEKSWKVQDPQLPKSIWYFTDAKFVGFRVVRPLAPPTDEEKRKWWDPDVESVTEILERQRKGER